MFLLRFDMRAPDVGAPPAELYAAALEMASFANCDAPASREVWST